MSIKVKARINFNDIIEKLHKTAKDFAEKEDSGIALDNLAFNDKTGKFLGGGQYCIFMGQEEGEVTEKDKGRFLKVIQTYVHYFVGEEEVKFISEDDLQPIYRGSTGNTEEENGQQDDAQDQNKGDKPKENEPTTEPTDDQKYADPDMEGVNNESIFIRRNNGKLLKLLFEDGEETNAKKTETETEGKEQENNGKCIGYGIMYDIAIDGKKDTTVKDAISNKSLGLFGGMLADLRNIKVTIGGHPVNLGHVFDPKKWEEAIGMKDIDLSQVKSDVESAFKSDYRNNQLVISVEDKNWLTSTLNRNKKLTPEVKAKINKADYSVLIQAKETDPYYPKYNRKSIAKTASKAFGTTYNAGIDWNSVGQDDVIKIDDTEKATGSNYRKENDDKMTIDMMRDLLNREDNKNKKKTGSGKSVSESAESSKENADETGNLDKVKEIRDNDGKGKKDGEKDPKQELVQSEEYSKFVNSQIEEQNSKILKSLGENVETKYITNEECVKLLQDKDINNTEFVNQIRDMKENCLVTTMTKSIGKDNLKENRDIIGELLREYDIRHGKIISESEEKTSDNIEKETIKTQRITGDEKKDDEYQRWALNRIDVRQTIGNVQQEIQQKISTAYKNIFLNTQNNFKELKDVKLEFTTFQTSMPLDSEVKNESFNQHSELMKMLFEAEEAATRNDDDDEWIRGVSAKLTQEIYHLVKDGSSGEGEKKLQESEDNKNNLSKGVGSKGETVEQNGKTVKADGAWNLDEKWMHPYPTWYSPFNNMKSHVQDSSYYCIASYSDRVQEFLTNHKITDGSHIDEKKFKYCALIIKKRDLMYSDNKHIMIFGGMANDKLKDDACQNILDKVAGKNNRIDMVHSTGQDGATIHNKSELLTVNLGFFNKKRCKVYSEVFKKPYPIPELDVWIRPFNKEDVEEPPEPPKPPEGEKGGNTNITINNFVNVIQQQQITQNTTINNVNFIVVGGGTGGDMIIPPSVNIKMQFIFIMPDPIIIKIVEDGTPVPPPPNPQPNQKGDDKKNGNERVDWYIIPHKRIKSLERHHERSTDQNGVTTTHTSNAEYKPKGK